MNWWPFLLVVVVAIAIVWYAQRRNVTSADQRQADERRTRHAAANDIDIAERANVAAATARADNARPARKSGGLLQEATDIASGRSYERAADQIGEKTADLAKARRDAELAAERLAGRAGAALAAVQAAAATHGGAVPGDGTEDCPPGFPIKGAMTARQYVLPTQPSYEWMIPDVCFQSDDAADAAGFTETGDDTGVRGSDITADAGDVPPGAVRGDGSRDCPPTYPIKANQSTRRYLEAGSPEYAATVPELCFSSIDSAQAAGMAPALDQKRDSASSPAGSE